MSQPIPTHATIDEWIAREAIPFDVDSPEALNTASDKVIAALDGAVELLGFGEALHGGEEILILRNRLFQRLVEAHGFSAMAVESSFPRGSLVNEYVAGLGQGSFEAAMEAGFSHGFGRLEANRELVEWMRQYNADPAHKVKLRFYGFDSPTEMMGSDSPRQLLSFVLDYISSMDRACGEAFHERIEPLLGADAEWENPAAMMDPALSIGLSPAATALRIEVEELISELHVRRPEWVEKGGEEHYLEAVHDAAVARWLLGYHAAVAGHSADRFVRLLGLRDTLMADNLAYMTARERGRGKVLAFAHNMHLKRGRAEWQWGDNLMAWWPAGAHLKAMLGARYAVIGTAVGVSGANGIGQPEEGTLEARLIAAPGPVRFIPTHQGRGIPEAEIAALPTRSGSTKNQSYFALTPQSLSDFDGLAVLDTVGYNRGGPPLP